MSAFSLCYSTESQTNRPDWLSEYFIKRFFRIAPLFFCIIAFELARQILFGGRLFVDFNSIVLNMTFTSGFVPFSNFVWGGWSVSVEMIFYAIFPVLILTIRTHRSALILLVMSVTISYCIRSALHAQHMAMIPQAKRDWSYFAFQSNMCFFAMGIYAYHVSHLYKESILVSRVIPILAVIIIGGLLFFGVGKYFCGHGRWDIVLWGLGLMALCVWQSTFPSLVIANRFFEYLGERSFSVYLLHPILLSGSKAPLIRTYDALQPHLGLNAFFVCAIMIIAFILLCAEFSYRYIEVPGKRMGRELIKQGKQI